MAVFAAALLSVRGCSFFLQTVSYMTPAEMSDDTTMAKWRAGALKELAGNTGIPAENLLLEILPDLSLRPEQTFYFAVYDPETEETVVEQVPR